MVPEDIWEFQRDEGRIGYGDVRGSGANGVILITTKKGQEGSVYTGSLRDGSECSDQENRCR